MADPNPGFEEEVVRLGGELFDGSTTHQDHDRRLKELQLKYDVESSSLDPGVGDRRYSFEIDFHDLLLEQNISFDQRKESAASVEPVAALPHYGFAYDGMPSSFAPATTLPVSNSKLRTAISKTEGFIKEWTPFLLVASYFIFSTCLYMICSGRMISIFWFIYLTTNFYIAGSTVVEAIMSISPCRDGRRALRKVEDNHWTFPTPERFLPILDLVTVAYLPNEKDIILDRIQYALDEIIYPRDRIRINIVYNTPKAFPSLENEMLHLTEKYPQLRIIKVPGSQSKADNLNYFFTLDTGSDVIAVFDCDHYPHPCGPRWAAERFMSDRTIDIVQGRCVIFNSKASVLSAMIAVEFDKIYAVSHPGRAATWGFGLFTGSNGYWRATLLRDLRMNGDMLTEDIDSSLRAVSRGAKTVHDLNVVSYELAPTTLKSFWNQRLRWAQGWAQASVKHVPLTVTKSTHGSRSVIARGGLVSLLFIRELSYYLVTQYCCLVLSILITDFPKRPGEVLRVLFFQYPVAYWLFIIRSAAYRTKRKSHTLTDGSAICLIGTLVITYRAKSEFVTRRMIVGFSAFYPVYLILTATIGLYGHARQVSKYSSWNPTART